MADNKEPSLAMVALIIAGLILFGVGRALQTKTSPLHRRFSAPAPAPLTAAGQFLEARSQVGRGAVDDLVLHAAAGAAIVSANRLRPTAALLVLLSLVWLAIPLLLRARGHPEHWHPLVRWIVLPGQLAVGLGATLAIPAAWPRGFIYVAGASAAIAILTAIACLLSLIDENDPKGLKLEHGPEFRPPDINGQSILLGRADSKILPGHIQWLARKQGRCDIRIPFSRLSCGVSILGEKGSGKSRLLFSLHDAVRAAFPDVPILIHDPKGEWYRTYYDPKKDIYFAPHFKGSAAWGLWNDFKEIPELRQALISSAVGAHRNSSGEDFWSAAAVDMLVPLSLEKTFQKAVEAFQIIPKKHAADKTVLSIFATAKLGFLDLAKVELQAAVDGLDPLSINDFINHRGRILLLNDPSCVEEQTGAFSLFLAAFMLRILSMPDVPAGTLRAVVIVDEALTFHLPEDVDRRIYALCRSKGLCVIAGAQRLPDRYAHERGEWQNSEYIFAMKVLHQNSQIALSKRAGQVFFRRKNTSTSIGKFGESKNESEQEHRQDIFPAADFGRLAPREFVVFHDQGMISGRSIDSRQEQREIPMPKYAAREDAIRLSVALQTGDDFEYKNTEA